MARPANQRELTLFVGDTSGFSFELFNDVDAEESLLSATRARFVAKTDVSATATTILDLDTTARLTINTGSNTIDATLTAVLADALVAGDYIASLNVEFGTGNWKQSDRFLLKVRRGVASNLA